jgi:hypothetical protein
MCRSVSKPKFVWQITFYRPLSINSSISCHCLPAFDKCCILVSDPSLLMFLITRVKWVNTSGLPKCFLWSGPLTYVIESESGGLMSEVCMSWGSTSSTLFIQLPYALLGAAFWSSVSWCKTQLAITFLMCEVWVRILKTGGWRVCFKCSFLACVSVFFEQAGGW